MAAGRRAAESIHRIVHQGQAQELGRDPEDYRAFKRRELRLPPELLRPVPRQQAGEDGLTPDQVRAACDRCDEIFNVVAQEGRCPNCGSFEKTVLSRRDFTVREIHTDLP